MIEGASHLFEGKTEEVGEAIESARGLRMNEAVIVAAVRTAVGKAPNGALRLRGRTSWRRRCSARRSPGRPALDPAEIDDVMIGCAMPEAEQGLNVARIASLRAGLPVTASAVTVNRFCASGLEAIAIAADRFAPARPTSCLRAARNR